ncbi:MAG: FAD-dependent oxidoreductase [Clostridiales bacterium]|nr:FAD-dependent oxidoreductase [Clostridiales bacterium]
MAKKDQPNSVTLKGTLKSPGVYAAEGEMTINDLLFDFGGGPLSRPFKFAVWGGPQGVFVPQCKFGTKILKENTRGLERSIMAFDEGSCAVNAAYIFTLYNYQKNKSLRSLGKITAALGDIIACESKYTYEKFVALVAEADDEAKKFLLPLLTALEAFGDEFKEHCDMAFCRASVCESMFRSPCANACPAGVDLPGTIALMQKGKHVESVALGRNDNPFLLTCGRICEDLPCQKHCQRQIVDKPVYSRSLHKYGGAKAAEQAGSLEKALDYPALRPKKKTDKKVAVVGAGPAGLTAAYFLARYGHQVTVFERRAVPGGMMRVGIPDYRLPVEVLNAEVNHIASLGVEIKYNQEWGKDFDLKALREQFDAVYVSIGAHKCFCLRIEGDENVLSGIDFLRQANLKEEVKPGKSVLVIGGGNVAIDVARVAWRLGSENITMVCREEADRMPATHEEIELAQEEGIKIINAVNPASIRQENGKYVVKMQKLKPRKLGALDWIWTEEYFDITVDTVIAAIGQFADTDLLTLNGLELAGRVLKADKYSFATSLPGVFGGGDCVLSPRTAVEAVGTGKKAADAIHQFLLPGAKTGFPSLRGLMNNYVGAYTSQSLPQQHSEIAKVKERRNFDESEKPYTDEQAKIEMQRCICSAKTGVRRMSK